MKPWSWRERERRRWTLLFGNAARTRRHPEENGGQDNERVVAALADAYGEV